MVLQALSKRLGSWRVDLGADAAHIEAVDGGQSITVDRASTAGRFELHDLWAGQGVLVLVVFLRGGLSLYRRFKHLAGG